jgi:hypothetical protein
MIFISCSFLLASACVPDGGNGGGFLNVTRDADEAPGVDGGDAMNTASDAEEGAENAGVGDAEDPSDAGEPDLGGGRDARPRDVYPDATVPDVGGCPTGASLSAGSAGPINLAETQNHGLPGCYRCGMDAADFDGDGRIDLVMAGAFDSVFTPGGGNYRINNRVRVYQNVSCPGEEIQFVLQAEMPNTVAGGGGMTAVGDFNGDGRPDFAAQFREGEAPESDASAFLNNGNWSFTKHSFGSFDTQSTSLGMAKGDFDLDGLDDVVFNSDAYGAAPGLWYRWNGTRFEERQTDFPHRITYGGTIAAGDLNGDGFADIAVGGNSDVPFGSYDCSGTLLYGQLHFNAGDVNPRRIESQGLGLGRFAMRADPNNPPTCNGMDNASMQLADMDNNGTLDIVVVGSADAFPGPPPGPPQSNGSHYDFVVLFNRDGTGRNMVGWENAGEQFANGTTNGGTGNLDTPSSTVGDLDGDGFPEVFMQGHHRDYATDPGRYIYNSRLFLNIAGTDFTEIDLGMPDVGEGGQIMADFNNDGKTDLIFAGATLPFHSNGNNPTDNNNASTIFAYVYRNTRP